MATLTTRPDSRFWIACFGRKKRSTHVEHDAPTKKERDENKRRAQEIADAWQKTHDGQLAEGQIRRVFVDLTKDLTGRPIQFETVASFTKRWLVMKSKECSELTVNFYAATLKRFEAWLGPRVDRPITEITSSDVRAFLGARLEKIAAKTANHELKSLKTYFRQARAEVLIPESPTEFIKAFKEPKRQPRRAFSMEEIRAILAIVDDEWRSMVICALYTGQRLSDIASLTWGNFDLETGKMRIVTRKTGRIINASIPAPLLAHLKALPSPASDKQPLHPRAMASLTQNKRANALSREFGKILSDACIREYKPHRKQGEGRDGSHERQEVSFHTFRRTATTWLHEAGVAPAVVQEIIGHDSIDEHEGYIKVGDAAMADAAAKFPAI